MGKKLNQVNIKNNIEKFLISKNYELIGIRDLFIEGEDIYISLLHKDNKGFTINIYKAKFNLTNIIFKEFFKTNEYWQRYNVFSGGRIESYKNNKILSIKEKPKRFLSDLAIIDKDTANFELISLGHRNPQGLFYDEKKNIILNTEHGPKGGDELNLNFLTKNEVPNYGWDIASYGTPYTGEDKFKKSHVKFGFVEPFKNYTPSIGISEVVNLTKEKNPLSSNNNIFISSLRAGSIYIIETDDDLKKILSEDRIFFKEQRIRDIEYDEDLKLFLAIFEYTPSIATIKFVN